MGTNAAIQIPGKAISQDGDVQAPVLSLLRALNLLANEGEDGAGFDTVFKGPPQSVALIEAGATTATKWWAGGIGATVVASWAKLLTWWGGQPLGVKEVALGGAFFLTAAAVGAIGFLFASDVRGRAAAAVATIKARERLAAAMIEAAGAASKGAPDSTATPGVQRLPLSPPIPVRNIEEPGSNEYGWHAIAMEFGADDGSVKYLVVKGSDEAVLDHSKLDFS